MNKNILTKKTLISAVTMGLLIWGGATSAVDWSKAESKNITLFSPGQMSWEYILTASKHSTAKSVKEGTWCRECHAGEEQKIGEKIGSGKKMEPSPVTGNPGFIPVDVKMATENNQLLVRLSWKETSQQANEDKDFQEKVAIMFNDGTEKSSNLAGCWGTCHVDAKKMPADDGKMNLTKYIFKSRSKVSRKGGGENYKSEEALAALLGKGHFFELWRAKLNPGQPAKVLQGYVLDKRHQNDATNLKAEATYNNGEWTVVFSRPLKVSEDGAFSFNKNKVYNFGIAIHDGRAEGRFHHVSFGYNFVLGDGKADFVLK